MASGNRPESSLAKAVHLTSLIGQDLGPVDALRADDQAVTEGPTYYLRVKPDRRRIKAAYPPHLERRSKGSA
jgi:hypothetical protein